MKKSLTLTIIWYVYVYKFFSGEHKNFHMVEISIFMKIDEKCRVIWSSIIISLILQVEHFNWIWSSISHLYGRAGGRKNYSAHSCSSILGRGSSPREQLTCPFAESDESELRKILRAELGNSDGVDHILSLKSEPVISCSAFLSLKLESLERNLFSKPSQYFYLSLENQPASDSWLLRLSEYQTSLIFKCRI